MRVKKLLSVPEEESHNTARGTLGVRYNQLSSAPCVVQHGQHGGNAMSHPACVDIATSEREFSISRLMPVAHTVALFELHFRVAAAGVMRERFDISVDVRFARLRRS
jgi:hypothetical protein